MTKTNQMRFRFYPELKGTYSFTVLTCNLMYPFKSAEKLAEFLALGNCHLYCKVDPYELLLGLKRRY